MWRGCFRKNPVGTRRSSNKKDPTKKKKNLSGAGRCNVRGFLELGPGGGEKKGE